MVERCEQALRLQRPGSLGRSGDGVHPVPCCAGNDRVEAPAGWVPCLERRYLDVDPGAPGELGHPSVGLHAEDGAAGCLELPSFDAGAAPDVEDVSAGARSDDPVDQDIGIARPGTVIACGV